MSGRAAGLGSSDAMTLHAASNLRSPQDETEWQ